MRSNSLDVKLRKTEKELKAHEQEIADQLELHTLTVKELELAKAAHSIAVTECQQLKTKISEQSIQLAEFKSEADELRSEVKVLREAKSKLTSDLTAMEQVNHTMEGEKQKLSSLRETYGQLQRSYQHLEKDMGRRKEREAELLTLTEKLSSANAELQAERSSWETKVTSLSEEVTTQRSSLLQSQEARKKADTELAELREDSHSQVAQLVESLEQKSKAVEQLTLALEDEREQIKALKRKHTSNTKDLHRQIAHCKRRMEQLEAQVPVDRESPATLPITEGSRASSHSSIDALPPSTLTTHHRASSPEDGELRPVSPAGQGEMFQGVLDQEKRVLVEKICSLKRDMARCEEKMEFFESHSHQLTEDIQKKSKIIQNFIMREQTGALAPPSSDEHKVRHSRKTGIMASVFSGVRHHGHDVNLELSVEMNRKMQSVLEDTLLKNITLKESIETLGQEIQRLSTQLQAYETASR
jgi:chromosome segregation ATPase